MTLDNAILNAEEKAKALGDCDCGKEHIQLTNWLKVLKKFHKAAKIQECALHNEFGGWGHSIFCNYSRDEGNGSGHCNCGVADMLSALKEMQAINE